MEGKFGYRDDRQFHYSSGEDGNSFSDDGSTDEDETPWKRRKNDSNFSTKTNGAGMFVGQQTSDKGTSEHLCNSNRLGHKQVKGPNKIWSNVLQGQEEQEIEQHMINLDPSATVTARDVESYKFKPYRDTFRESLHSEEQSQRDHHHHHHHHEHHHHRHHGDTKRKRHWRDRHERQNVKERLGRRPNVRDRLGTRNEFYNVPIMVNEDDDPETVAQEIIKRLGEQKYDLIRKIVEVVGNKKALQLLRETEQVEETGGMMTQDGSRRRRPGGVYLTMLKSAVDISKEQLSVINEFSRKLENQAKKKAEKRRKCLQAKRFKTRLQGERSKDDQMVKRELQGEEAVDSNMEVADPGNMQLNQMQSMQSEFVKDGQRVKSEFIEDGQRIKSDFGQNIPADEL
ncbi:phosphorylated adapter RNA export protein-like [Ptychodera flava]|uniref:phosphorylated adapter RNA export protein-like n=1 Tax=Ptychodera flava TaxID=63121 RepID=UPI003969D4C3